MFAVAKLELVRRPSHAERRNDFEDPKKSMNHDIADFRPGADVEERRSPSIFLKEIEGRRPAAYC
jgi:hypothetical protein